MNSPLLIGCHIKLTRNLPVCTSSTVAEVVDISKQESGTPLVGLEHLNSGGHIGTSSQITVERMSQVIVQLNVLCTGRHSYCHANQRKENLFHVILEFNDN